MKTRLIIANRIGTVSDLTFPTMAKAYRYMMDGIGVLENELEIYAHNADEELSDTPSKATLAKITRAIKIEGECDVYCTNRISHPHPLYSFTELA
jgi:hypothetical protein